MNSDGGLVSFLVEKMKNNPEKVLNFFKDICPDLPNQEMKTLNSTENGVDIAKNGSNNVPVGGSNSCSTETTAQKGQKTLKRPRPIPLGSRRCTQTNHDETIEGIHAILQDCDCHKRCHEITLEQVKQFYKSFVEGLTTFEQNKAIHTFLHTNCEQYGNKKQLTRYFAAGKEICHKSALRLLGISSKRLTALKRYGVDEEGRIKRPKKQKQLHKKRTQHVHNHLNSILEGHLLEHDPSHKMLILLPGYITKNEHFYNEYRSWCTQQKIPDNETVEKSHFYSVWKHDFPEIKVQGASFMECNLCCGLDEKLKNLEKIPVDESKSQKEAREKELNDNKMLLTQHKNQANSLREIYKREKDEATKYKNDCHVTMDYSSAFTVPFKKRNPEILSMGERFEIGMFGISDHSNKKFHNFMVPQTAKGRKRFKLILFLQFHFCC